MKRPSCHFRFAALSASGESDEGVEILLVHILMMQAICHVWFYVDFDDR